MLAALMLCVGPQAQAQGSGIQVAPVMVSLSPQQTISALRLRNGRDRATAFEIDVYAWSQEHGRDVLTPSTDLIVAPGVFEAAAGAEQIVRVGVADGAAVRERAYRLILRELPRRSADGAVLGFTLELSLPVFVTPPQARPVLDARVDRSGAAPMLRLVNLGDAHAQLGGLNVDGAAVPAPRYMLAGASAEIELPSRAAAVRLAILDGAGAPAERVIDVRHPAVAAAGR